MRRVTSIRGRFSRVRGRISKPLTRSLPASQRGARPARCRAMAISSPAVRMVAEPQRSTTMPEG
jgi:hypothetical protein